MMALTGLEGGTGMAEKSRGIGWVIMDGLGDVAEDGIVNGIVAIGATFAVRKVITVLWTRVTGKEPPIRPEDPRVALPEALGWSLLTGVTIGTARLLAIRLAAGRRHTGQDNEPASIANG
jgi:hypothetical protein